jgi:hypothetical protein
MSIIQKLTEGMVHRDLAKEGAALLTKWEKTGLLEGITDDRKRSGMAVLLENQAKELLRESSTMSAGDVEGFASVAFPIVRRVFAQLVANDLVSVQPMSLPSGLIFFLDFTYTPGTTPRLSALANESPYGQGIVGREVTGGVSLSGVNAEKGFYGLNNGYSSPTGSSGSLSLTGVASGSAGDGGTIDSYIRFDPDVTSGSTVMVASLALSALTPTTGLKLNVKNLVAVNLISGSAGAAAANRNKVAGTGTMLRRLTSVVGSNVLFVFNAPSTTSAATLGLNVTGTAVSFEYPIVDVFQASPAGVDALGAIAGTDTWGLEASTTIPELDIKVESISVTAITKKLKAKWSPELGQDLNAYHNLDAEVELTSLLSEHVALEIDREIMEDLIKGATAGTFYWSRSPGLFVNRTTGLEIGAASKAPDFTGTVSQWYETLIETINDVSAQIHRKTLRGGANFIVCGPEVANILEFTSGFRAKVSHEDEKGEIGAVNVGSISKKFDVYVAADFLRNVILVGRKGNSFLESGYVYAPYVPLQVTPTIFGQEDFVPRKGVMTRYAKKMVRPDMYGLVICRGLLGESGA